MLTPKPMFVVRMFAPGWACVFVSFHRSRREAERHCRQWQRKWAHRPQDRTFDVMEA